MQLLLLIFSDVCNKSLLPILGDTMCPIPLPCHCHQPFSTVWVPITLLVQREVPSLSTNGPSKDNPNTRRHDVFALLIHSVDREIRLFAAWSNIIPHNGLSCTLLMNPMVTTVTPPNMDSFFSVRHVPIVKLTFPHTNGCMDLVHHMNIL